MVLLEKVRWFRLKDTLVFVGTVLVSLERYIGFCKNGISFVRKGIGFVITGIDQNAFNLTFESHFFFIDFFF